MAAKKDQIGPVKKTIRRATKKGKKVGAKLAHAVAETPEFLSLQRKDRAIRNEIDGHLEAIGKRVRTLHKLSERTTKGSPFVRYQTIVKHLEELKVLEKKYRDNRVRLNRIREEIRGKGRR